MAISLDASVSVSEGHMPGDFLGQLIGHCENRLLDWMGHAYDQHNTAYIMFTALVTVIILAEKVLE